MTNKGAIPGFADAVAAQDAELQAQQQAWREIQVRYAVGSGKLTLSDRMVLRCYEADLRGEDWRLQLQTSPANRVLKVVALIALFPFMFVMPRTTQSALQRIDERLTGVGPRRPSVRPSASVARSASRSEEIAAQGVEAMDWLYLRYLARVMRRDPNTSDTQIAAAV